MDDCKIKYCIGDSDTITNVNMNAQTMTNINIYYILRPLEQQQTKATVAVAQYK